MRFIPPAQIRFRGCINRDRLIINNTFHALHRGDWEPVAELLRIRVLKFFAKKGKLSAQEAEKMRQWHHSGFGIHAGHRIQKDDHDALENLGRVW
ncbi:MAG: hypothetical protein OSB19_18270 [Opitutaceae bacterium]|nr:hypothetical protein [Opitutaceae bacterium]